MKSLIYISLSSENVLNNSFHNDILEELQKHFQNIEIFCLGKKYRKKENNITIKSGNILDWLRYAKKSVKPDMIYINDYFIGGAFGVILKKRWCVPVFLRCGSPWKYDLKSFPGIGKTILLRFLRPLVIRNCHKVVYNSKSIVCKDIKHNYEVIYNGVDTKLFRPMPEIQTKSDKLRLISIGNINKEKGLEYLFEAIKDLHDKVSLTIVGDGLLLEEFKRKNSRVGFMGRVEHSKLPEIINQHDVLVHPSYVESFPNVILEAMACGKPVIACDVFGIAEILENMVNCILVQPNNSNAIKDAVNQFIENKKLIKQMGNYNIIKNKLEKETQIQKFYIALFENLY